MRRSRGYAPLPISLPFDAPPSLAVGGDVKNTFCLAEGRLAWMSGHIGDMDDLATQRAFGAAVEHLSMLTGVEPRARRGRPTPGVPLAPVGRSTTSAAADVVEVQHHHAHVASTMAEHGVPDGRRVIGVAFDGTGYGDDGAVLGRGVPGRRLPGLRACRAPRVRRPARRRRRRPQPVPDGALPPAQRRACRGIPRCPASAPATTPSSACSTASSRPACGACRRPAWDGSSTLSRRWRASATAPSTTPRPRWSSRRSRGRSGSPSSSGAPGPTTSVRTATRRRSSGRWCRTSRKRTDPGLVAARFQAAVVDLVVDDRATPARADARLAR